MRLGSKRLLGWFGRGAKKAVHAVDPATVAARAADKAVDKMKDDQFIVYGRSWFDWSTLSLMYEFRLVVEDKET